MKFTVKEPSILKTLYDYQKADLKKIFENLEESLGENLVKETLEEDLKELKYSVGGLAVDYIGQESYARSLEKEKENLREEILSLVSQMEFMQKF